MAPWSVIHFCRAHSRDQQTHTHSSNRTPIYSVWYWLFEHYLDGVKTSQHDKRHSVQTLNCQAAVPGGWTAKHTFNGPLSGTTRVSRYQKGKTNLDFTEARDSEWQWHQLGNMQVCTSLQTDNHASTPPLMFFTGWMPFLPPNQQRQSNEGQLDC